MSATFTLREPYLPPFDFDGLMLFHRNHRIGELEWFTEGKMHRVIHENGITGEISIANDANRNELVITVQCSDRSAERDIRSRVRGLFDLDAKPALIKKALTRDPGIRTLFKKHPGLRIPSGWDPFEIAIATILGQLVSVEWARRLLKDLMDIAGQEVDYNGRRVRLFPTPRSIVDADLTGLKTTRVRKQTLKNFAQAVLNNQVSFDPSQNVDTFVKQALAIKGIGPWTANYMALKIFRHPDAFPASDLIIARALKLHSPEAVSSLGPWRGYLTILLWKSYAKGYQGATP